MNEKIIKEKNEILVLFFSLFLKYEFTFSIRANTF